MVALPKLVVILGPTACGKSGLGVGLAARYGGEIVSADSRQVYRGMDLGTGKITPEECRGIPHHLLDILEPGAPYSAAQYQRDAYGAIDGILARGKLPFLVGGSGLYLRAVTKGFAFQDISPDSVLRAELSGQSTEALYALICDRTGRELSESERHNRQRLLRTAEKVMGGGGTETEYAPRYETLLLGVAYPREEMYRRIEIRLADRLAAGMIEEVAGLRLAGVPDAFLEALGLEYRYILRYLTGRIKTKEALTEELGQAIRHFAKRQVSWFQKDDARWLHMAENPLEEAAGAIDRFLSGEA